LENPERVTHNFVGDRWIELAEIQAIESVSGGLTMKCQVCHLTLYINISFHRRLTTFACTQCHRKNKKQLPAIGIAGSTKPSES
jgi:hypothetical protein